MSRLSVAKADGEGAHSCGWCCLHSIPGSEALHGWGSEHRISSLPHHLVIFHITELTLVYIMLVSILYVNVTTATLSQGLPSLAHVNRGPEVLWVGFLSPAAPAPFSGILFDFVTFNVQKASPTS